MTYCHNLAEQLVAARRSRMSLPAFPGRVPDGLEEAYAVQSVAIDLWDDVLAGWKAGRFTGERVQLYGTPRFIGPVFASTVVSADGRVADFPAIPGGFAACECEFVLKLKTDAPAGKTDWTVQEAREMTASLHIGMEIAGSAVANLLSFGALASLADLGTNVGLIVGPEIADWSQAESAHILCTTLVDNVPVASRAASELPGGPFDVLAFTLGQTARLGRPMRRGHVLSTGALNGVHPVVAGQQCSVDFGALGRIDARVVAA